MHASSTHDLLMIAERYQPLLLDIIGFLAESPGDITRFCSQVSTSITSQAAFATAATWRGMFERRWPACADSFRHHTAQNYSMLYKQMSLGRIEFHLEVFDREKKRGFTMAAMPARVHFEAKRGAQGCYIATYISASIVPPEAIPVAEENRLRFCPTSAREALAPPSFQATGKKMLPPALPEHPTSGNSTLPRDVVQGRPQAAGRGEPQYPHKVFAGLEGLTVGGPVELQWKMQVGSPFGWWCGRLERLVRHEDGTATATIIFGHFPETSQWYRLNVRFGDGAVRASAFGGYTGGLRQVTAAEHKRWMPFFPQQPLVPTA